MNQETWQPLLHWIGQHPIASGLIVFLISLSESLAVVGLLVPGVVLMTAIGAMIGSGVLPAGLTLSWAILGAIVGDGISYWLGHHYKEHILEMWPFSRFPSWLERGQSFFARHGGTSIVLGRFVGPVRPMIPVIAGMMGMPAGHFFLFNVLSAIAWAPIYSFPGILIGMSLGTLSRETASRVGLLLIIAIITLWLLYTVILKLVEYAYGKVLKGLEISWHAWRNSGYLPKLCAFMSQKHNDRGQLGAFLIVILSISSFIWLSYCVHQRTLADIDAALYQLLSAIFQHSIAHFCLIISALLDPWVLLPVNGLLSLYLAARGYYLTALCFLGASVGSFASAFFMKDLIQAVRPDINLHPLHGYSFPSGHLVMTTVTFGLAATLLAHHLPRSQRILPWALSAPIIIIVALARLYLGLHWFSDILGGLSLSLAWIGIAFIVYRHFETSSLPSANLLGPLLVMIALAYPIAGRHLYGLEEEHTGSRWPSQRITVKQWWAGEDPLTLLCRQGAVKRQACVFNLQWLGSLTDVQRILEEAGWHLLPGFEWEQALHLLDSTPPVSLSPVPEFHRDRLPVLLAYKVEAEPDAPAARLLIELWQSDMDTDNQAPLWVGLIRRETLRHPLPLIRLYYDDKEPGQLLQALQKSLQSSASVPLEQRLKTLNSLRNQEVLLIDSSKRSP